MTTKYSPTPWIIDKFTSQEIIVKDAAGNVVHHEDFREMPSEMGGGRMEEIILTARAATLQMVKAVNEHAALCAVAEAAALMFNEVTFYNEKEAIPEPYFVERSAHADKAWQKASQALATLAAIRSK